MLMERKFFYLNLVPIVLHPNHQNCLDIKILLHLLTVAKGGLEDPPGAPQEIKNHNNTHTHKKNKKTKRKMRVGIIDIRLVRGRCCATPSKIKL